MVRVEVIPAEMIAAGQAALEEIVAILVAMCKKQEARQ